MWCSGRGSTRVLVVDNSSSSSSRGVGLMTGFTCGAAALAIGWMMTVFSFSAIAATAPATPSAVAIALIIAGLMFMLLMYCS